MPSLSITAAAVGAAGALGAAATSASASKSAANQAMTGYNYLTTGAGAPTVNQSEQAGVAASQAQQGTQGTEAGLLTATPGSAAANTAFQNYLGSTGYNFQLDTGSQAISGNMASKGLLNSGATAKALTTFGQNLGSSYFNNYLNQLSGLNTQQGNTAAAGQNAATMVGNAGTGAGSAAAQYTQNAGNTMGSAITNLTAGIQNVLPQIMNTGSGGATAPGGIADVTSTAGMSSAQLAAYLGNNTGG